MQDADLALVGDVRNPQLGVAWLPVRNLIWAGRAGSVLPTRARGDDVKLPFASARFCPVSSSAVRSKLLERAPTKSSKDGCDFRIRILN